MANVKISGVGSEDTSPAADVLLEIESSGGTSGRAKVGNLRSVIEADTAETTSFTFALADIGVWKRINNAGATAATIPPNTSVAFPVGTMLVLEQTGAGACTWTAGSGVTINVNGNYADPGVTNGQYSITWARQDSANTWTVGGQLVPLNPLESWSFALSDETTALTASTSVAKLTWRTPYAITLTDIKGSVTTAPVGATLIMDVHEGTSGGTTIMTTNKIQIETTELTSDAATTQPTLTDTALAEDAEITFYVDQVGSSTAGAGAKVTLIGRRT